ncbi:hypothetical protein MMC24_005955 [Lignoscripta atroalba]|nr:hypothetical protein [Lignoscripta atroalba]
MADSREIAEYAGREIPGSRGGRKGKRNSGSSKEGVPYAPRGSSKRTTSRKQQKAVEERYLELYPVDEPKPQPIEVIAPGGSSLLWLQRFQKN